jgi:hypothetical protein
MSAASRWTLGVSVSRSAGSGELEQARQAAITQPAPTNAERRTTNGSDRF